MEDTNKSVLSEEHKQLLIDDDWIFCGTPPSCNVHDEYWIRHLHKVQPRCSSNPDKPLFVELQVFARRTFRREPGLGVQLVLCAGKRDRRWVNLMTYGMQGGINLEELEDQTAQLVAAWKEMNKVALDRMKEKIL